MIRKREKQTGDNKSEVKNVDVTENPNTSKQSKSEEQFHTFLEQAIEVLNILDSQGIDIYDSGRTPGMYLKRHTSQTTLNQYTIGKILHNTTEEKSSVLSEKETSQTAPSSLIDFLSKKK